MKKCLKIYFNNIIENCITTVIGSDDVIFNVNLDINKKIDHQLTDDDTQYMLVTLKNEIEECKNTLEICKEINAYEIVETMKKEISIKENLLNTFNSQNFNSKNIVEISNEIDIDAEGIDEEKIVNYIKLNEQLFKGKKIFIGGYIYNLNNDSYTRAYNLYHEYDNVNIYIDGNNYPVTLKEYKITLDYIDNIVNHIKKFNYSPLEQLIYAYDIVRGNKYNKEDENEESRVSRDLTSIITGNKIVCVGFTKLFNAILDGLGIKNMDYNLESTEKNQAGHVRSLVYLQDLKYNIDSLYLFDPTWDSLNDEYNCFDNYLFFGKTFMQIKNIDKENKLYSKLFPITLTNQIKEFEEKLNNTTSLGDKMELLAKTNVARSSQFIADLLGLNYYITILDSNDDIIIKWLNEIVEKSNIPLPNIAIIQALYCVRKDEHEENSDIFSFDRETFIKIILNSFFVTLTSHDKKIIDLLNLDKNMYITNKINRIIDELNLTFDNKTKKKRS